MKRAPVTIAKSWPGSAAATHTLFKADYPRAIDRYIDYFGGGAPAAPAVDACGEALLDEPGYTWDGGRRHVPLAG